jgi:hypothetical protein
MKFGITVFAALGVIACGHVAMLGQAAAGDADQAAVIKVADQDVVLRVRRSHRVLVPREPYDYPYPVACESVLFPRSPACAGRPAAYGPYATYPWNFHWSH